MDDFRPATTPAAPDIASAPLDADGLWRDGGKLVVAVRGAHFPKICAKTGQSTSGQTTCLELTWTPNHALWTIMFGIAGHVIAKR